jgi:hypothetical protein
MGHSERISWLHVLSGCGNNSGGEQSVAMVPSAVQNTFLVHRFDCNLEKLKVL